MKSSGNSSAPSPRIPSTPNPGSARSRKRFALTGPSLAYDPDTTAARRDLADVRLADRVFAPHYAQPMPRTVAVSANLTHMRDGEVMAVLVPGDVFEVLEVSADHAWGVAQARGLVGYLPLAALAST